MGLYKDDPDKVLPQGNYQQCLEHALVMAHLLEHAIMFLPMDSELWHRAGCELKQFGSWINDRLDMDHLQLDARRQRDME